jgi:4-hydroxybenzoate polyprenyltransferase
MFMGEISSISPVVSGLIRECRPQQWYKQSVMFVAILFSKNIFGIEAWLSLLFGVISFTSVISSIYIINDISDVEEDRQHPEKQNRPIASGQVGIALAATFASLLIAGGLSLALWVNSLLFGVIVVYLVQNILYSTYLRKIVLVDIIVIAFGFVLRAVAGAVAVGVFVSPWLIICSFLTALVLAIGKRQYELQQTSGAQVGKYYRSIPNHTLISYSLSV